MPALPLCARGGHEGAAGERWGGAGQAEPLLELGSWSAGAAVGGAVWVLRRSRLVAGCREEWRRRHGVAAMAAAQRGAARRTGHCPTGHLMAGRCQHQQAGCACGGVDLDLQGATLLASKGAAKAAAAAAAPGGGVCFPVGPTAAPAEGPAADLEAAGHRQDSRAGPGSCKGLRGQWAGLPPGSRLRPASGQRQRAAVTELHSCLVAALAQRDACTPRTAHFWTPSWKAQPHILARRCTNTHMPPTPRLHPTAVHVRNCTWHSRACACCGCALPCHDGMDGVACRRRTRSLSWWGPSPTTCACTRSPRSAWPPSASRRRPAPASPRCGAERGRRGAAAWPRCGSCSRAASFQGVTGLGDQRDPGLVVALKKACRGVRRFLLGMLECLAPVCG